MKQADIKTQRLILRPFSLKDAAAVQRMAGNYNIAKMTLNVPNPYLPDMAEEWIETHPQNWESGTAASYAITVKQTKELIGVISLVSIPVWNCWSTFAAWETRQLMR